MPVEAKPLLYFSGVTLEGRHGVLQGPVRLFPEQLCLIRKDKLRVTVCPVRMTFRSADLRNCLHVERFNGLSGFRRG